MKVKVKFLLWLSDKAGTSSEELVIQGRDEVTLRQLLLELSTSKPQLSRIIEDMLSGRSDIIVLVDSKTPTRGLETPIRDGAEVVLMPPVSGG